MTTKARDLWIGSARYGVISGLACAGTVPQRDARNWTPSAGAWSTSSSESATSEAHACLTRCSRCRATCSVPEPQRSEAYRDSPLPIGHNQTISQPYIVAFMTQALDIAPEHRVLEIGTGSGYQAAVLRYAREGGVFDRDRGAAGRTGTRDTFSPRLPQYSGAHRRRLPGMA